MRQDSVSIGRFYAGALGATAARILAQRIADLWGHVDGLALLGHGYALPLLGPFASGAARVAAVIPEEAGHARWPGAGRGNASLVAPEARLPFRDDMFDRAILLHSLEEAENPRRVSREVWRVMAPEGRVIVAAASRHGLWSRAETTPFGHGRPWTLRQLAAFLGDGLFQVTASTHALFMPPLRTGLVISAADEWERAGGWVAPALGGVVLVEAVKRLYIEPGGGAVAPTLAAAKARSPGAGMPRERAGQRGGPCERC